MISYITCSNFMKQSTSINDPILSSVRHNSKPAALDLEGSNKMNHQTQTKQRRHDDA